MKKIAAGCMVVVMGLLTACSGGAKADQGAEDSASGTGSGFDKVSEKGAKGRYMEAEIELPEYCQIYTINQMKDGTVRMITDEGIMDSKDGGENFEAASSQPDVFGGISSGATILIGAAVDKEGNVFLSYTDGKDYQYLYVDKEGKETEVSFDLPELKERKTGQEEDSGSEYYYKNGFSRIKFLDDSTIIAKNPYGMIFHAEAETGKVMQQYGEDEGADMVDAFEAAGGKVFAVKRGKLEVYDLESGDLLDEEENLKKYIEQEVDHNFTTDYNNGSPFLLERGEEEDVLYFCDPNGMIRYQLGASEVEYLMNGALNTMSNPQKYFKDMVRLEDGKFLVGYLDSSMVHTLFQYEYKQDISAVPEKEIKVYTLEDNENIRQAVSKFQAENPDYYINFEVGLTEDNAITKEDAIKTLNTNIMAGKGPDILLLDGMPAQSYEQKGLLADLSDVLKDAGEENKIFSNITELYKSDNGVCILPTRFKIPVVMGKDADINKISDIKSLVSKVEELRKKDSGIDSIIGDWDAKELVNLLLNVYSDTLIKEDGTVDEAALKEFLECCEKIYKANGESKKEKSENFYSGVSVSVKLMEIASGKQLMNIGTIDYNADLDTVMTLNEKQGWSYKEISEGRVIPMDTVGVNAKSENIEDCKKFIKTILSVESQRYSQVGGLPVNEDAYVKNYEDAIKKAEEDGADGMMVGSSTEDGGDFFSFETKTAKKEEYEGLKKIMENVRVPEVTNEIILNAIRDGGEEYLEGNSDLAGSVNKILQTVNLYLSE